MMMMMGSINGPPRIQPVLARPMDRSIDRSMAALLDLFGDWDDGCGE